MRRVTWANLSVLSNRLRQRFPSEVWAIFQPRTPHSVEPLAKKEMSIDTKDEFGEWGYKIVEEDPSLIHSSATHTSIPVC